MNTPATVIRRRVRIEPEPPRHFRLRMLPVYLAAGAFSAAGWFLGDFSNHGVPELDVKVRLELTALSLAGPLATLSGPCRASQFGGDFWVVLAVLLIALALALWKPTATILRWLGYVTVVCWVFVGTAIAFIPF